MTHVDVLTHLFSGILGGLLVAVIQYAGDQWRYRNDQRANFWHQIHNDLREAADLATDYWLRELPAYESPQVETQVVEARIIGYQVRLSQTLSVLEEDLLRIDLLQLRPRFADFFDALSGGEFGVPGRPIDVERARAVQHSGALLAVDLRRALRRRSETWR